MIIGYDGIPRASVNEIHIKIQTIFLQKIMFNARRPKVAQTTLVSAVVQS